jgi:hypothetical protein
MYFRLQLGVQMADSVRGAGDLVSLFPRDWQWLYVPQTDSGCMYRRLTVAVCTTDWQWLYVPQTDNGSSYNMAPPCPAVRSYA